MIALMITRSRTDPPIAISQVPRSKNSSISPMSRAVAMKPPIRAPRMPIAVVPMQPPGSVWPGMSARAIAPAKRPRKIQPMMPMAAAYSAGPAALLAVRPGFARQLVVEVPGEVTGGAVAGGQGHENPLHARQILSGRAHHETHKRAAVTRMRKASSVVVIAVCGAGGLDPAGPVLGALVDAGVEVVHLSEE